jgi:ABC-type uncharacterized transport system substrate-binding protein
VIAGALAAPLRAEQEDVVLLSKENPIYRLVAEGYAKGSDNITVTLVLSEEGPEAAARKIAGFRPRVVVAVGDAAGEWALREWHKSPLVLAGVLRRTLTNHPERKVPAVVLDVPPERQFKLIKEYLPGVKIVGTVMDPFFSSELRAEMERAAPASGLTIWAEPASENREFSRALEVMSGKIDAFLLVFDPTVLREETFRRLAHYSMTQRVPLVVPAFALLKSGAVLSLEASYETIGRQAAETADALLAGRPTAVTTPRKVEVGVNLKASKNMGVPLDKDAFQKADRIYE